MQALSIIEGTLKARTFDELLETFLAHLLRLQHVRNAEISLYNRQRELVRVAKALNIRSNSNVVADIRIETLKLDSTIRHTSRRIQLPEIHPTFSFPLIESTKILGFLNVKWDRIEHVDNDQLGNIYLSGLQLAGRIREIKLCEEIDSLREQLRSMAKAGEENIQQITALSKELYAISAIATKINQSMDFDRSLQKSMAKIREVFKVSGVLVYTTNHGKSKPTRCAIDLDDGLGESVLLKKIEREVLRNILNLESSSKGHQLSDLYPSKHRILMKDSLKTIVCVPLGFREKFTGVLLLVQEDGDSFPAEHFRLLSGIANIMGMAIENMTLYQQSEQKKREATFLVRSISKFNEKLDLQQTLTSVSEKAAEFIGPPCQVYLFSETKIPFIQTNFPSEISCTSLQTQVLRTIQPEVLKEIFALISPQNKSILVKSIRHWRKIGHAVKLFFQQQRIHSLMAVPLKALGKPIGLLLLTSIGSKRVFDRNELAVAEALGAAASVAIENAWAYQTSLEMSEFFEKKIVEKSVQLRQIQERQRVRVENRKDIIFRVNRRNRFVFVNHAMEELSGFTREDLYRGHIRAEDVVAGEDRDRVRESFKSIVRGEVPIIEDLEYRHMHKSGEFAEISLTIYPELDHSGHIKGVEGVGRNITERKRLEAELEKAKELAMLGEFSGAVAHQLRNPLSNILMGTKVLQKALGLESQPSPGPDSAEGAEVVSYPDRGTLSRIFADLSAGIHNLNQVVTELIDYTKTLKLKRSLQRIDLVMGESLQIFEDMLRKNRIRVKEHVDPQVPPIAMDAVLMGQVLRNVIHNAIQAMPSGGILVLECALYPPKPGHALVSICDSGIGFELLEAEKIFRPFYTTKHSGTGLGLSLAYRIVEAHKGQIWACKNPCPHLANGTCSAHKFSEPLPSAGTTIHILLPMTDPHEPNLQRLR